jgi:L,D-peptidoglycan transpeptidase YkuD (ErfK/YbiS/YcfS/YnhG family)
VRRAVFVTLVAVTAGALIVVARGSSPHHPAIRVRAVGDAATTTAALDVTTTTRAGTPSTTAVRVTTTTRVAAVTTPTTSPHVAPTTNAPPSAAATTTVPAPVLEQRIVVRASGYGTSSATFTAYARTASGWQVVFGPWSAHIGRNGFAPPGAKREGDGRTPSGTYGFSFFFGIDPDPGVHYAYRRITSPAIVWDDDPASPSYNLWIDTRVANAGANPEPMDNAPVYDYGAVIAYNTARTPGLGSAIFLHVSSGSGTAGCVSLPTSELLSVLRWLDPALAPTIAMGVGAA